MKQTYDDIEHEDAFTSYVQWWEDREQITPLAVSLWFYAFNYSVEPGPSELQIAAGIRALRYDDLSEYSQGQLETIYHQIGTVKAYFQFPHWLDGLRKKIRCEFAVREFDQFNQTNVIN